MTSNMDHQDGHVSDNHMAVFWYASDENVILE